MIYLLSNYPKWNSNSFC